MQTHLSNNLKLGTGACHTELPFFQFLPLTKMTKTTITIVKTLLTAMLRLREWLFIIHRNFFKLLTFTYAGAYRHHTRLPIEAIAENQDYGQNKNETIVSLVQFRRLKTEELRFVQGGVI